ncbi:MAG: hypothetical protein KBB39_13060 [Phycicoccus sp.]|nr:hypothetical protein [Phycicoccus sp.]
MRQQIRFSSFGIGVELDLPDHPSLNADLAWVLPPQQRELTETQADLRLEGEESNAGWCLTNLTTGAIHHATSAAAFADVLEREIRHYIALHAPGLVFIHAGAIEVDGSAVVIPGWSTSGKSTLVRAFIERGCGYLSDEYAVIDRDGLIVPYARALSLRQPDGSRQHVPVEQLGGTALTRPLVARAILSLPRRTDLPAMMVAGRAHAATMILISNTVAARTRPQAVLAATAELARHCDFLRGHRGEAGEAVEGVLEHLRGPR